MPQLQPIAIIISSTYTRPVTSPSHTPIMEAPSTHHTHTHTTKLCTKVHTVQNSDIRTGFGILTLPHHNNTLPEVFQSTENQLSCTGYAKILPRGHCENHQLSMNLENTRGRCESPCSSDGMMCSTFVNCSGRRKSPEVTLL